jgi:predicted AAA+ superfamily ATPase
MPEKMSENLEAKHDADGDIHPGETTEEKVSLSERFGLWLSFYPFGQDHYLEICAHWLAEFGVPADKIEAARGEALQWSLMRGSRSGRVAWQFARDYAGKHGGKPPRTPTRSQPSPRPRPTAGIAQPAGSGSAKHASRNPASPRGRG